MVALTPIKDLKYDFTNPDAKFDAEYFFKQADNLARLQKIDPNTKEGLEAYLKIDPNASTYDDQALSEMREGMAGYEGQRLGTFSKKNAKGLVGLLREEEALQFALQTPAFRVKGKSVDDSEAEKARKAKEDKYNSAVEHVSYMQEVFRRTGGKDEQEEMQNKRAYIQERLSKLDPKSASYGFFLSIADKLIEGDKRISQKRAVLSLNACGVQSYLGQNIARTFELETQPKAQVEADQSIRKLIQAKDSETDVSKKIKLIEEIAKAGKKYEEDFRDNILAQQSIPQVIGALQSSAYQSVGKNKAEAAAKKKAEEEAKKKEKK